MGGTGSGEDQRLRVGVDMAVAMVQDQGPEFFADGGSAWFTGAQDSEAA